MRIAKYIVWDGCGKQAVVFDDLINHSDMARALGMEKVLGAGFCYLDDGAFHSYGKSISLNIHSRGQDDDKILNEKLSGNQS